MSESTTNGDRVVIVGDETLITRILAIEDLSGIEEPIREVVASAQSS